MRKAVLFACLAAVPAALVGTARGADPATGTQLSVEGGRGVFTLEVRGSTLGTLSNGSIVVVDRSLSDPYTPIITGRRVVQRKLSPTRVQVRGWGLRFRMLGGSYRFVIRGSGLALSTVGRGFVLLDGEPRVPGDEMGVYSLDGADCSTESQSCVPVPDDPIRLKLAGGSQTDSGRQRSGAK